MKYVCRNRIFSKLKVSNLQFHNYWNLQFHNYWTSSQLHSTSGQLLFYLEYLAEEKRHLHQFLGLMVKSFNHSLYRGSSPPFFKAPTPEPSFHPFFKLFVFLPSFLFYPLLIYFRQFPLPSCKTLLP